MANLYRSRKGQSSIISEKMIPLAMGIVTIAVVAALGIVVLMNMATSQSGCPTGFALNQTPGATWYGYCTNISNASGTQAGFSYIVASISGQSGLYAAGYVGSTTTGGMLTWLPVIIPAVIGLAIIGYFLGIRRKTP